MNARWAIADRIKALVPATDAGHRAKTAVAIVLLREGSVETTATALTAM